MTLLFLIPNQYFKVVQPICKSDFITYSMAESTHTVGEKIIWSPADFVRLPNDKEMISL